MRISVTSTRVDVIEVDDLRALDAVISPRLVGAALDAALGGLGTGQGDHLWLDIAQLRSRGRPNDPAWCEEFASMIAFAARSGWTNEDRTQVRCHVAGTDRPAADASTEEVR